MKRETITQALGGLDDRFVSEAAVYAPGTMQEGPERIVRMKKKRFLSIVLAAALILALGITAYAAWSTHAARQEEIKADLKIEENNVSSYAEYPVPGTAGSAVSDVSETEAAEPELVLLSAVNAGDLQRVYVNISPVSEKCIADYPGCPGTLNFSWSIDGTGIGGFASPRLPSGLTLHGQEAVRDAVLQYAYDRETQTLTLECIVEDMFLEKAAAALGTDSFPFLVHMSDKDIEMQTFGPVSFTPVDEQARYFDFGHAVYTDAASGKSIEISGLELTPFGAVWKVRYEGAEAIHSPNGNPADAEVWSMLEDKVCIESQLFFSDGSAFSTGGALTAPYTNGAVELHCEWGRAINIDGIQKIVLGDLVLWKNDPYREISSHCRQRAGIPFFGIPALCLCPHL